MVKAISRPQKWQYLMGNFLCCKSEEISKFHDWINKRFTKAIKILMAVVIGALVLGGLYSLFGDTVLPTLTQKIRDMFNYSR